jgi:hypothetical protein
MHYALRIKPLVRKRRWRGMSIKRKKNFEEVKNVETSFSFLIFSLDGEVFKVCCLPAHEVEEATNLNDEESEDPVEATQPFFFLHTKTKRWSFSIVLMVL